MCVPNFRSVFPARHWNPWRETTRRDCSPEAGGPRENGRDMCGRISYSIHRAELLATYSWLQDAPDEVARYNIAPTDPVLAVGPNSAEMVRWGMDGRKGGLFNLRSETATTKPYYHRVLLGHRVVVPASHFYEWRAVGGRRLPFAISRTDGKVLCLAGVLGCWENRPATTILTTFPTWTLRPSTTGCRSC